MQIPKTESASFLQHSGMEHTPLAYIHKYEFMHDIYIYMYIFTQISIYIYTLSILVHILYRDVCVVFLRFDFPWLGDFSFGRPVLQVVAERHDLPLTSLVDAAQAWQKWSEKKRKKTRPSNLLIFGCVCDAMFTWIIIIISPSGGGQKLMSFFFFHVVVFY